MIRPSTFALACGLLASNAFADVPTEAINRYLDGARAVVAELQGGEVNATAVVDGITAILDDAKPVAVAYGERHEQCAAQLARMIELYPEINGWTPQEIRRNIEGAAALPAAEGCYPARDVVAHPAIVRAIARNGIAAEQTARLLREMNEAIEHMEEIAAELAE